MEYGPMLGAALAQVNQNAECRMQNAECRMQNAKCKMQNAESIYILHFAFCILHSAFHIDDAFAPLGCGSIPPALFVQ
jgi:hypothetical protein